MEYNCVRYYPCTPLAEQHALSAIIPSLDVPPPYIVSTVIVAGLFLAFAPTEAEQRFNVFISQYNVTRIIVEEGTPIDQLILFDASWQALAKAFQDGDVYPDMPRCSIVVGFGSPT